jgi:GDPmannose 4,6-dehydratase
MSKRVALIFGVTGQDGAYLARHLLGHDYRVHGVSRDRELASFRNLARLEIADQITVHSASLSDFRSVVEVISKVAPDEIYNLAGQSSVGLSFEQPVETLDSTIFGPLNLVECIRLLSMNARLYNASSSECFGNIPEGAATETTPFHPRSPYGVGKAAAFWTIANYREAYGLFACSGILFNHESPLRPRRFVTRKIVSGAVDISQGLADQLSLGNLAVARDFGWAPEYVEAMWAMLQTDTPQDYVIATGETHTLQDFTEMVFERLKLDWERHVVLDPGLNRPTDIKRSAGRPDKALRELGWQAKMRMPAIVDALIEAELALRQAGGTERR